MFDKVVVFTGKHANYIRALAQGINRTDSKRDWPFKMNYQVLITAPLLGRLHHRSSPKDYNKDIPEAKIFVEQLLSNIDQLELIYRTIVLLEKKDTVPLQERMNRAFRYDRDEEKRSVGDEIFNGYVRGGIEILYEQLIEGNEKETREESIHRLSDFVCACSQYGRKDDPEWIYKFCKESGI